MRRALENLLKKRKRKTLLSAPCGCCKWFRISFQWERFPTRRCFHSWNARRVTQKTKTMCRRWGLEVPEGNKATCFLWGRRCAHDRNVDVIFRCCVVKRGGKSFRVELFPLRANRENFLIAWVRDKDICDISPRRPVRHSSHVLSLKVYLCFFLPCSE